MFGGFERRWRAGACAVAGIVLVVAASAGLPGAAAGTSRQGAPTRPNIVLILSDDQRFDTLDQMPNVEKLIAAHGVTFKNAFVTTSECCPSRASILSGQYSHTTGVVDNFGPSSYPQFDETSNLAVWLHAAGYDTALVGKYLNDYTVYGDHRVPSGLVGLGRDGLEAGGEVLRLHAEPERPARALREGAVGLLDRRAREEGDRVRPARARAVLPRLRAGRAAPPGAAGRARPHDAARSCRSRGRTSTSATSPTSRGAGSTAASTGRGRSRTSTATSRGASSARSDELDRQVGALMHALAQKGVLDNTIVIYASDNGFLWGEHRLGGKLWPYEESIRVPLVVRTPWQNVWGTTSDDMALNIDFASTIAELAGVTPRAAGGRAQPRAAAPRRVAAVAARLRRRVPRREPVPRRRPAAVPGRSARRAGCTSSTGTGGASCTTSAATRTSCGTSRPTPASTVLRQSLGVRLHALAAPR